MHAHLNQPHREQVSAWFAEVSDSTPATRAGLELLGERAEEARRKAQRASSDLYAAMSQLKQTEGPLLNAQQEAKVAAAVLDSATSALQEAQANFEAPGLETPAREIANKKASAAKDDAGESMSKITAASNQAKAHLSTCREAGGGRGYHPRTLCLASKALSASSRHISFLPCHHSS